jgi:glucose-6-phosphate 1-epimerase
VELTTLNKDKKSFKITQALHSYFSVTNISDVRVKGLDSKPYLDALSGMISHQVGEITFDTEIDRVYQEVDNTLYLEDENRTVSIENAGSMSCVVWNPWIQKCKRMSAMDDEAYKEFVCIETANAYADFKVLEPGESHTLQTTIK